MWAGLRVPIVNGAPYDEERSHLSPRIGGM